MLLGCHKDLLGQSGDLVQPVAKDVRAVEKFCEGGGDGVWGRRRELGKFAASCLDDAVVYRFGPLGYDVPPLLVAAVGADVVVESVLVGKRVDESLVGGIAAVGADQARDDACGNVGGVL